MRKAYEKPLCIPLQIGWGGTWSVITASDRFTDLEEDEFEEEP